MTNHDKKSLTEQAQELRGKAEAISGAPILTKMGLVAEMVGPIGAFLVELAAKVDAITPYLDDGPGQGGDDA